MAVLIGRGLDHSGWFKVLWFFLLSLSLCSVFRAQGSVLTKGSGYERIDAPKEAQVHNEKEAGNAPLAQLVEHLTLNQGVHGSSP